MLGLPVGELAVKGQALDLELHLIRWVSVRVQLQERLGINYDVTI